MKPADQLAEFVAEALRAGQDRDGIAAALRAAGWSATEIDRALLAWSETDFPLPVPRPRAFVSAREAFLYGLLFAALVVVTINASTLGFDLIDRWLPPEGETARHWSARSMRWAIAYLVVFFPVFLALGYQVDRLSRADMGVRRSSVRKWFGYITLFLALATLLGDLVAVVFALLDGSLTSAFLAKTALVATLAGLSVFYVRAMTEEAGEEA